MTKQNLCSTDSDFADAQTNLVLEAQRIVFWAGSLADEGEKIGGIGAQIQRAARLLRLHEGVVWRAWYERAGPEIFPCIDQARNELVMRIAQDLRRKQSTPWRLQSRSLGEHKRQVDQAAAADDHAVSARARRLKATGT